MIVSETWANAILVDIQESGCPVITKVFEQRGQLKFVKMSAELLVAWLSPVYCVRNCQLLFSVAAELERIPKKVRECHVARSVIIMIRP